MNKIIFLLVLLTVSNNILAACPSTITGTIINVKTECGATGNGTTDDTFAIQDAINKMAYKANGLGGDVYFPAGKYLVKNAIRQNPIEPGKSESGDIYLNLKSNVNLRLDSGATIKAAPDNDKNGSYNVLYIRGKKNIRISGGTIEGERSSAYPPASQYGMDIGIYNGSTNITIDGTTVKNAWGDGIYIGQNAIVNTPANNNILINAVIADGNRRNALSLVFVDGIVVKNSGFRNTAGTEPGAGIDIEPNPNTNQFVKNIILFNNSITNNRGGGIKVGMELPFSQAAFQNIAIIRNSIAGNKDSGININKVAGVTVLNNTASNNVEAGIIIQSDPGTETTTSNNIVAGNTTNANNGLSGIAYGISLDEVQNNVIVNNSASNNNSGAIWPGTGRYKNAFCTSN